jgi:Spy/CpxP family protein refolding chaperone
MNKTWLKRTLLGVAVSTALLGSVAAYSQGNGFHHGPPTPEQIAQHEQHMLEHVGKKLNLNAGQAAKLKALADLAIADHAPPAAGTDPHAKMAALISGAKFDRSGAQALANQHVAKMQADAPGLINAFGDFYDSLDATQQAQLRELAARHHGMFMFGMGGFGGHEGHHRGHDGASGASGS